MAKKGKFITFEGGEGCGKSTQIEQLISRLQALKLHIVRAREPGGTDIGDQIRHILKFSYKSVPLFPEAELLLFCANRAQLVREVIGPALKRGDIVISDRFYDSTTVYQGLARGLGVDRVRVINDFAVGDCKPDLTIVVDIDPKIGLVRVRERKREQLVLPKLGNAELFDRMENQGLEFYNCVRQGYLDLARDEPSRVKVVDGSQPIDVIAAQVWELVKGVL